MGRGAATRPHTAPAYYAGVVPSGEWEWRGYGEPASGLGAYPRAASKESLHPHLSAADHAPHLDYVRGILRFRLYLDGTFDTKRR